METIDTQQDSVEDSSPTKQLQDLQEEGVIFYVGDDLIETRPDTGIRFQAELDKDGIIHLTVKTIKSNGSRHPYFQRHRASDIAKSAIGHFDQFGGVKGLAFDWGKPESEQETDRSDNYTTYLDARNILMQTMDYESAKRQAALQTWTFQNIALPLDFSEIPIIEEKGDIALPTTVLGIAYRTDVFGQEPVAA